MNVGETRVRMRINGPKASEDLETLVDTGATLTKIPASVAEKVGIKPIGMTEVELADGSVRKRAEGYAEVELFGRRRYVPLLIGPDCEQSLLGLTTLEIFRLKVNPVTQKLEEGRFIEYLGNSRGGVEVK